MSDKAFEGFLLRQREQGLALAQASDLLRLRPLGGALPQRYLAEFTCRGLVQAPHGGVAEVAHFAVGIFFPPDYLRRASIPEVLSWLEPRQVFHPNVRPPFVCVGRLEPGTGLVDILYQIFEIIVYRKYNPREDNALNQAACAWARRNRHRLPTDPRPLKRVRRPDDAVGQSRRNP